MALGSCATAVTRRMHSCSARSRNAGEIPGPDCSATRPDFHRVVRASERFCPCLECRLPRLVKLTEMEESVRKDVERTFGQMKSSWRCLKIPCLWQDEAHVDNMFVTCCILHNMMKEFRGKVNGRVNAAHDLTPEEGWGSFARPEAAGDDLEAGYDFSCTVVERDGNKRGSDHGSHTRRKRRVLIEENSDWSFVGNPPWSDHAAMGAPASQEGHASFSRLRDALSFNLERRWANQSVTWLSRMYDGDAPFQARRRT